MNDRPLFQDADEQEAIFAPEQLPGGSEQTGADERAPANDSTLPIAALPIAATGAAASSIGPGYAGGSAGTTGGVVPALAAVALANEAERNDEDERRRD